MKFFLVFLVLALVASEVLAKKGGESKGDSKEDKKEKNPKNDDKPCPVFRTSLNLSNTKNLDKVQDNLIKDLWDLKTPKLTKLGKEFKTIINEMRSDSKISEFEETALAVTLWSWAYLPQMSTNPDLSGYTNLIIDEESFFLPNGLPDCPSIVQSLNDAKPSFVQALNYALDTAIENSKCRQTDPTKKNKGKKNEIEFNDDDFWDIDAWMYPEKWQKIAKRLSKSSNDNNQLIGFFVEAFVSDAMMDIVDNIDKYFLYEIFAMAATGELPKKCCDKFINNQMELRKQIDAKITEAIDKYRKAGLSCA